MNKPNTIICDIDGTLLYHHGDLHAQMSEKPVVLEGVREKLHKWDKKGYNIILITGRRESCRQQTEMQLQENNIFYDQLIMGIGGGNRILINDRKPDSGIDTAYSINIHRNEGIAEIEL